MDEQFDKQVERNLRGIELKKAGKVEEAIELYEQNIKENFIGSHPYDELAIIYRKQKRIDDEIRVLEKAILVFENFNIKWLLNRLKLKKFRDRLEKARILKQKSK